MLAYTAPSTVEEAVRAWPGPPALRKSCPAGPICWFSCGPAAQAGPDRRHQEDPRHLGHSRAGRRLRDRRRNAGRRDRRMRGARQAWPGVVEAANLIGSTQIQGRASLAGNLCNASPAADSVPALIAARATCVVAGANGRREIPVESIVTGPGRTSLARDEFIVEFHLPKRPPRSADAYLRFIPRTEMDIAVVGAGVSVTLDAAGVCTDARVVLGAVAPTAVLVADAAAALIGRTLDETALAGLDQAARRACKPIDDKRGTIAYRTKVAGVMARRAATSPTSARESVDEQASRIDHHQRRADRVPVRAAAHAARRAARRAPSDRQQGGMQLGRLRRLQRDRRRPPGLLVPDACGRGRRPARSRRSRAWRAGQDSIRCSGNSWSMRRCSAASARRACWSPPRRCWTEIRIRPKTETRYWLAGNLCRCTGYDKVIACRASMPPPSCGANRALPMVDTVVRPTQCADDECDAL